MDLKLGMRRQNFNQLLCFVFSFYYVCFLRLLKLLDATAGGDPIATEEIPDKGDALVEESTNDGSTN